MIPHERSLVQKLQGRPFAFIGVNSDPKETALASVERNKINWRSFWDGGSPTGPIATAYQVQYWPAIYLIDGDGVIQHKNLRGGELDQALDKMIAELETAAPNTETPPATEEPGEKPAP